MTGAFSSNPLTLDERSVEALAKRFAWCAEYLYGADDASPLYRELSTRVATDEQLLRIAAIARVGQPAANLFFAAVHFLIFEQPDDPLAAYFPDVCDDPLPPDQAWDDFRAFCLRNCDRMRELIQTHGVQTNEVRRCACLLPAFGRVAKAAEKPLAIIEIGTSAGLNLLWDSYRYEYSNGKALGDPDAALTLTCEVRGEAPPPIPEQMPPVGYRLGMDLSPVDVQDAAQVRWLRALIWPEQLHRRQLLDQAIEVQRANPAPKLAGDAIELLPDVLDGIPEDLAICIFHSYTLNQFRPEMREVLGRMLVQRAQLRHIYRVSIEWLAGPDPLLQMTTYKNRMNTERILARCDDHGEWLEWYGADYN